MTSKARLRAAIFLLTAAITAVQAQERAPDQTSLDAAKIKSSVERWLVPYVAARDFSGVVVIAQGDHVLARKSFGMADFARHEPNTPTTRFRIASLSKTFTASAIESLVRRGKLSLDEKIESFVP